jgi:hypothetical protein
MSAVNQAPPPKRGRRGARAPQDVQPMVITSVTYDGYNITVNWQPFTEDRLMGYVVSISRPNRLDNVPVKNKSAVQAVIGYILEAGVTYQCWITPLLIPGVPDEDNASQVVPIPYPAS